MGILRSVDGGRDALVVTPETLGETVPGGEVLGVAVGLVCTSCKGVDPSAVVFLV